MKVSGALAKSAAVMQSMNNAIKLPAIQQTMMAMGREMEKVWSSLFAKRPPTVLARVLPRRWWWCAQMGLIEEFMDDALELDEDEEDEAQEEIDKVRVNMRYIYGRNSALADPDVCVPCRGRCWTASCWTSSRCRFSPCPRRSTHRRTSICRPASTPSPPSEEEEEEEKGPPTPPSPPALSFVVYSRTLLIHRLQQQ